MKHILLHITKTILLTVILCLGYSFTIYAQTAITAASTSYTDAPVNTSHDYTVSGSGTSGYPTATSYDVKFNVGNSNNLTLTNIEANSKTFLIDSRNASGIASFQRKDNINIPIAVSREVLLYEIESIAGTTLNLKSDYIATMKAQMESEIINRGIDNIFVNGNSVCYNNVERFDKVFSTNLSTTLINDYGFLILERGGNDAFKIAAITGVDGSNNPISWGSIISVSNAQWGNTGASMATLDFKYDNGTINSSTDNSNIGPRETNTPDTQYEPMQNLASQAIKGVFISFADLGIASSGAIYGYSLFSNDVNSSMNSSDIANIADDTNYPPYSDGGTTSGLDLIAGMLMVSQTILPVNFINFEINKNILEWSTDQEFNNDRFEIEISNNGTNYKKIGEVKSYGSSNMLTHYKYVFYNPIEENAYIRLKQIDNDGNYSYSKTITNNSNENVVSSCTIKKQNNLLTINSIKNITVTILIYDITGTLIYQNNNFDSANSAIDTSELTPGLYIINITDGTELKQIKFLINH